MAKGMNRLENYDKLISRYKNKGILIDTNLLLVYLIGSIKPELISKFKRTKSYIKEDYQTLHNLIDYFGLVVTTPNILTEVNNLPNSLDGKYTSRFYQIFSETIMVLEEHCMSSKKAAGTSEFGKFGITDTTLFYISKSNYLLLTDDFRLSQYVQSQNGDVINFNHIRE
jgi:hypothetical protein